MLEKRIIPEPWRKPLDSYMQYLRLASASRETLRLRHHQLGRLACDFPAGPKSVTAPEVIVWLGRSDWALETRRSHRAAVRGFFKWAVKQKLVKADPCIDLPQLKPPQHVPRPAPDEVVIKATGNQALDPLVLLMLLLAVGEGLRRGEIARTRTTQVTRLGGYWWLTVEGKGGKIRQLPLWPELAEMLLRHGSGYVFPGKYDGHLSPDWVGKLMARALGNNPWTAHTLRHHFACRLYDATHDIYLVKTFLGHARLETTLIYTKIPELHMRESLASLGQIIPGLAASLPSVSIPQPANHSGGISRWDNQSNNVLGRLAVARDLTRC